MARLFGRSTWLIWLVNRAFSMWWLSLHVMVVVDFWLEKKCWLVGWMVYFIKLLYVA